MSDLEQLKQRVGSALTENNFLLDQRTVEDLLNLVAMYTEKVPFAGHLSAVWESFWMATSTPKELNAIYQDPELAEKKLPVQQAFLLALLGLLETPRALLNTLPARHHSLYYRDLLGFSPRPPQPDSVTVSFTLQKNTPPYWLPSGSLLDGGQDSSGNSVHYQTDDGLLISGQQLAQLCWTSQVEGTWKRYTAIDTVKGITLAAEGLHLFTETECETETLEKASVIYLGFSGTSAQDILSLYWSVRASSSLNLTWWYFQGTQWTSLDAVVQDDTGGLSVSNLWRAQLPEDAQPGGGELDINYYWIKGTLTKGDTLSLDDMPKLHAVLTNAMTATLNMDHEIDDRHFVQSLPANSIKQLVKPVTAISDILQVLPSRGGQPRETETALFKRVASRIAHRNRAITWSNMSSLLMEQYPEIFDVRIPNGDRLNHIPAPEEQSLMIIPNSRNCDNDDARRPALSPQRLAMMAQWLAQHASLWVKPTLKNPKYINVTARYRVAFVAGVNPEYGYRQLAEQLQQEYMPWETDQRQAVTPGNKVDYYRLLASLQQSSLVQSVSTLMLIHDVTDDTGKITSEKTQSTILAKDDEVLILCPEGDINV